MISNIFSKFNKLALLLLINTLIVLASYGIFIDKFKSVNLDGLEQKINRELLIVNALKDQLISLEGSQTFDKFDLAKQTQVLKIIASAFNLEASAFKSNKKGDVYVIRGNTKNIVLLAYKLNKIISNKGLRAQVRALIITGNVGVLEVHVFGVDND